MTGQTFKIGDRVRVKELDRLSYGGEEGVVRNLMGKVLVRLREGRVTDHFYDADDLEPASPDEQAAVCAEIAQTESDEQALKDAVVEAGMEWYANPSGANGEAICKSVSALLAHALRTPKAEEIPAPRCEPPQKYWHHTDHFVKRTDKDGWFIRSAYWDDGGWYIAGGPNLTVDEATRGGWSWHGLAVVKPNCENISQMDEKRNDISELSSHAKPLPIEQEPTEDAIVKFALEHKSIPTLNSGDVVAYTLDALRTFKPLPAEIEVSDEGLGDPLDLYAERWTELCERKNTTAFDDAMDFASWYHAYKTTGKGAIAKVTQP